MDSWYGNNADLLLAFRGLGMKFVAAIKSNRNVTFSHKKQYARELFAKLEPKDVDLLISQQWNKDKKKWIEILCP